MVPLSLEAWCGLTLHALHTGDHGRALAYPETMLKAAQQARARAWPAQIHVLRGHVLAGMQRLNEAETECALAAAGYAELGQDAMLGEPQAGLAWLALARGDLRRALDLIEPIVRDLEAQPLPALDDPFRIDQVCCRVLQAHGDGRWVDILCRPQRRLHDVADTLGDYNLSRSFLEHVALHRELLHPPDPQPPDVLPLPAPPTPAPSPS